MTRDEQKLNKELRKRLPQEIRKLNKKYKIQYAHEFLYRFEGDFLYIGMPSISSVECGKLQNSVEIKPWVLDETYWRTQKMDMDEMLRQPMSLHVRGAFTVGNIYFKELSVYEHITNDNLSERVEQMLIEFDKFIDTHKKVLTNVNCLINDIDGYTVSDLNKSLVYIRQDEYEKGLLALKNEEKEETIIHVDSNGKTSKEYIIEECLNVTNKTKKFECIYTLNLERYNEYIKGYMATSTENEVLRIFVSLWLNIQIITNIIINRKINMGYKKIVSQNNGVPVTNKVTIDETGIHSANINTNHKKDYLFEQILSITETKNLLILKMEHPLALILDKNNLKGGSKEEVIEFLFEKCKNIKKKKVYNAKIRILKDGKFNNEELVRNEEKKASENYKDSKTNKVELNDVKKKLHNMNDNILSRKFKERYNASSEEVRRKIDMIDNSADASQYQLKVIKRKRIYPEINDVFIINPCDDIYLVGAVLNNHINNKF